MKRAIVKEIQVGGQWNVTSLEQACRQYIKMVEADDGYRAKIQFIIKLPDDTISSVTIRDEDVDTIAYGDFAGLPSFLDYAQTLKEEGIL